MQVRLWLTLLVSLLYLLDEPYERSEMPYILFFMILLVPYPNQPDWESNDSDYSTGGALVDIDLDGDIDFVTGNGNDMEQEPNRVYYNIGDSLESIASWSSSDIGYNAHISIGDIDYDGYPELCVASYGDPATPQFDKLYYNISGVYGASSAWQPADFDNSFACALGDMDGDGDLDLAVACGEEYTDSLQRAKVYLNTDGQMDTTPAWETSIESYFYDVTWVDIDSDGDLDLALAGHHRQNIIYRNTGGMLENVPYWQSNNSLGTLKIAFGDIDNDGDFDMVCANNAQTGGTSNCELYLNNGVNLETQPAWTSQNLNYYSCVALGDVDRDDDLDLAAGGWWETVKVFENENGSLPAAPTWQWGPPNIYNLVCENISFGDVDNTQPASVTNEPHCVDSARRVFYLNNRWLKGILQIRDDDGPLNRQEYCFSYADGWVSVASMYSLAEPLWVDYSYSEDLDLIVTNWHESRGNFLFLNDYSTSTQEIVWNRAPDMIEFPNPNQGRFTVKINTEHTMLRIYDINGRLISEQNDPHMEIVTPGVYFMHVYRERELVAKKKIVVVR